MKTKIRQTQFGGLTYGLLGYIRVCVLGSLARHESDAIRKPRIIRSRALDSGLQCLASNLNSKVLGKRIWV